MSRPATARLKVNPPLGRLPVLQFVPPGEIKVDGAYQRSLETGPSQTLIRKIAQFWNWDLCQPLVVARRAGGELFVIDGQHRWEAARLRGDIAHLPCVVVEYASAADEAASFVHLNQQRRPLTKLDIFKAAVASEDPEACAILAAMTDAGLSVAPHTNSTAWKPGMVANIGGIERVWRRWGARVTHKALKVFAEAYRGEVLRFAGTIFPGVARVVADEPSCDGADLAAMLRETGQSVLAKLIIRQAGETDRARFDASMDVIVAGWKDRPRKAAPRVVAPAPSPRPTMDPKPTVVRLAEPSDGKRWCTQCDKRVHLTAATMCKDRFCKIRPRLTA